MPTRKIRVLIVDGSAIVRKLVTEALAADPEIEVVGTAIDPFVARDKIISLQPDVLTVDIEMPRMDGLTFLKIVMQERPMPVIVVSSLTQTGSHHALEALRLGAVDVVAKPPESFSVGSLGPELSEKIKAAAVAKVRSIPSGSPRPGLAPARPRIAAAATVGQTSTLGEPALRALESPRVHHPRRLIVLGASTGGTEALQTVLTRLPGDLPPIAIVQHIPPVFSHAFAQRLDAQCALEVREAVDGDRLVPGLALIAPGNFHFTVHWAGNGFRARVTDGPPVSHQRPSIDLLFASAAEAAGSCAIAGVFTGMGRDGAESLLTLRERGALTFSQDEASSVVYGMPRAAWELGGSQRQVPLADIAAHIVALADSPPPPSRSRATTSRPSLTPSEHVQG